MSSDTRKIYSPLFSPILQDQLEFEEGNKLAAYLDTKGVLTIGIGHNLVAQPMWQDTGNPIGHNITMDEAYKLLGLDLLNTEKTLKSTWLYYSKMTPGARKDAILAMAFQLGVGAFNHFVNFKMQVEHGHWNDAVAAGKDSIWDREVPGRAGRVLGQILSNKYYLPSDLGDKR